MKLNRKQELKLIDLGLQSLINGLITTKSTDKCRKWTKNQHKKFAASMAKKWTAKRAKKP
jgi:hypothetical protein